MATATATRPRRVSAKKNGGKVAAKPRMAFYTVTAYDSEGNVVVTSDGEMTIENANVARDFMRATFRPERVIVSDEFGYTY